MKTPATSLLLLLALTPDAAYSQSARDDLVLREVWRPSDGVLCPPPTGTQLLSDMRAIDPRDWSGQTSRTACLSSNPPVLAPFGDATYYVLISPLAYSLGSSQDVVVVPRGFVTDLASIPRGLWNALPRDGQYMSAAILHDYFYWDQRCTRAEADTILKHEMQEFGVGAPTVTAVYEGVRAFGQLAWNENKSKRETEPRIIPDSFLTEFLNSRLNADQTWGALQSRMKDLGIRFTLDPNNHRVAEICKRATSRR